MSAVTVTPRVQPPCNPALDTAVQRARYDDPVAPAYRRPDPHEACDADHPCALRVVPTELVR